MFDHPFSKKCFLMTRWYFSGCSFELFPCTLPRDTREKRSAPPSPLLLLRKLHRPRSPLSLLFSEVEKPRVLSHSPQAISSSPFSSIVPFLWMHSNTLISFNCRPQNCTQHSSFTILCNVSTSYKLEIKDQTNCGKKLGPSYFLSLW